MEFKYSIKTESMFLSTEPEAFMTDVDITYGPISINKKIYGHTGEEYYVEKNLLTGKEKEVDIPESKEEIEQYINEFNNEHKKLQLTIYNNTDEMTEAYKTDYDFVLFEIYNGKLYCSNDGTVAIDFDTARKFIIDLIYEVKRCRTIYYEKEKEYYGKNDSKSEASDDNEGGYDVHEEMSLY